MMSDEMRKLARVYVASRVKHAAMWKALRAANECVVVSTWIDEAGEGETSDLSELWERVLSEVSQADALILYIERDDFPLKGALVEVGAALALGKAVHVVLQDVELEPRSMRPVGSWLHHPNVRRFNSVATAIAGPFYGAREYLRLTAEAASPRAEMPEGAKIAEIIGPDGSIHYRRPLGDPMIAEAQSKLGYAVRYVETETVERDKFGQTAADYEELGRSFLEEYYSVQDDPAMRGYICCDSPVEIISHLLNAIADAKAAPPQAAMPTRAMLRDAYERGSDLCDREAEHHIKPRQARRDYILDEICALIQPPREIAPGLLDSVRTYIGAVQASNRSPADQGLADERAKAYGQLFDLALFQAPTRQEPKP
jgi:hypothetical protein